MGPVDEAAGNEMTAVGAPADRQNCTAVPAKYRSFGSACRPEPHGGVRFSRLEVVHAGISRGNPFSIRAPGDRTHRTNVPFANRSGGSVGVPDAHDSVFIRRSEMKTVGTPRHAAHGRAVLRKHRPGQTLGAPNPHGSIEARGRDLLSVATPGNRCDATE